MDDLKSCFFALIKSFLIIAGVLFLVGYYFKCQTDENIFTYEINDFSKERGFDFSAKNSQSRIIQLTYQIEGEIEGKIRIEGNQGLIGEFSSGKIQKEYSREWFSPEGKLIIRPIGKVKGYLKIKAMFGRTLY